MISKELYSQVLFDTVKRGATVLSDDVHDAFERAIEIEESAGAKEGLSRTLESINLSVAKDNPACPDTGWPIFYFKVGNECELEGGFMALEEATRNAVRKATKLGYLRSTMKNPLTGDDPGDNVGMNIPDFTYQFVPGNGIEITYVAKGGGSECFGGTRHRVVAFADGVKGIYKQVVDSYIASTRAGAVCPPSILGVGIGGTANVAANLAKKAACLRTVGSKHPDPLIRKIEVDLYNALNSLGIGIMGSGGSTSVLGVNVEYAHTHIAGICVATSTNCMVARRATSRITADSEVEVLKSANWFEGR
ncbi:MAG: fumarate hydratase [Christensenellales bacterium]|jgi:tartrate/fumarate subfamily iron-sulfur-dependent hydro-lyase alpha chain